MSRVAAYKHIADKARDLGEEWWTVDTEIYGVTIDYNGVNLTFKKMGYSGTRTPPERLIYEIYLGDMQPPDAFALGIWVYSPQMDNPGANKRAAIAAIRYLTETTYTASKHASDYLTP